MRRWSYGHKNWRYWFLRIKRDLDGTRYKRALAGVPSFDVLKSMAQNSLDFSTATDGAVFSKTKQLCSRQLKQTKIPKFSSNSKMMCIFV